VNKKIILSIGGWDPTAGAGVLLDSYLFSRFCIEAKYVLTGVTVQSPFEVMAYRPLRESLVRAQIKALAPHYRVTLINIGLVSPGVLSRVREAFHRAPIIFDPVLQSGSGRYTFLPPDKLRQLLPCLEGIYLLTPNLREAESLSGEKIGDLESMKRCARVLQRTMGVRNVLITGGDLKPRPMDLLLEEKGRITVFPSPVEEFRVHGTGSYLNAVLAAGIFRGMDLPGALRNAKCCLEKAVRHATPDHPVLRMAPGEET